MREFYHSAMESFYREILQSPVGYLSIEADHAAVRSISFCDEMSTRQNPSRLTTKAAEELNAYFEGHLNEFSIPLDPTGTEFERSVWSALTKIPFGTTCSYLDVSRRINNPKAIRAVGRANGANPIAIIVPCHRVIGSDGSLTGYAGGIWRKRWLLDHEARVTGNFLF